VHLLSEGEGNVSTPPMEISSLAPRRSLSRYWLCIMSGEGFFVPRDVLTLSIFIARVAYKEWRVPLFSAICPFFDSDGI